MLQPNHKWLSTLLWTVFLSQGSIHSFFHEAFEESGWFCHWWSQRQQPTWRRPHILKFKTSICDLILLSISRDKKGGRLVVGLPHRDSGSLCNVVLYSPPIALSICLFIFVFIFVFYLDVSPSPHDYSLLPPRPTYGQHLWQCSSSLDGHSHSPASSTLSLLWVATYGFGEF